MRLRPPLSQTMVASRLAGPSRYKKEVILFEDSKTDSHYHTCRGFALQHAVC